MAPIKKSNVERRKLREICRETLSEHIHKKPGIKVMPSQVRLVPSASDPYMWKFLPEKEEVLAKVFAKSIGDHSVGGYRALCDGVDVTFEAVPSGRLTANAPNSIISLQRPEFSFSSKIEQLQIENADLFEELRAWKDTAATEIERRQLIEGETSRLCEANQQLQDQLRNYADRANHLTGCVTKCFQGLDKVLPMLQEVRSTTSLDFPIY